jgi:cytolysin-activating lysine-acyltransferase
MQRRYDEVSLDASPAADARAAAVGHVIGLRLADYSVSQSHAQISLRDLVAAIRLGHSLTFFDFRGNPLAYAIWAYLASDVEKELVESGTHSFHHSEWNEGKNLWIIELCAPFGSTRSIIRKTVEILLPNGGELRYLRRKRGKNITSLVEVEGKAFIES